jgi:formate dehydrogenase maturation protein FdhE
MGISGLRTVVTNPVLTVTCPACGRSFASSIQMDPETWEGIRMNDGMVERCVHCERASRFSKGDYSFSND